MNVGSILEESIGIERAVMKLISKVLLIFERHICTRYRISLWYYEGVKDEQGGTGQWHILSAYISRDRLCIVIKKVENLEESYNQITNNKTDDTRTLCSICRWYRFFFM